MKEVPLHFSSGDGVKFDPKEDLSRSQDPMAGRMSLLTTVGIQGLLANKDANPLQEYLVHQKTSHLPGPP